jgi:hypothetical protein
MVAWTTRRDGQSILAIRGSVGSREFATPGLDPVQPAFSPSGGTIAFAASSNVRGIFVVSTGMGATERITEDDDRDPAWIDDSHIAFTRHAPDGTTAAYVVGTTDSTPARRLVEGPRRVLGASAHGVLLARSDHTLARLHAGIEHALTPPVAWHGAVVAGPDILLIGDGAVWRWNTRQEPERIHTASSGSIIVDAVVATDGHLLVATRTRR